MLAEAGRSRRATWARWSPGSGRGRSPACGSAWSPRPRSADALAIPAYGVCSLDAIGAAAGPGTVAGRHRRPAQGGLLGRLRATACGSTEPAVDRPADLVARRSWRRATAVGDGRPALRGRCSGCRSATSPRYPPAGALAALAAARVLAGAPSEPLTPLYLRRPDAVEPGRPQGGVVTHRRRAALVTGCAGGTSTRCCRSRPTCSARSSGRPAMFWNELANGHHYVVALDGDGHVVGYAGLAVARRTRRGSRTSRYAGTGSARGIGRPLLDALLDRGGRGRGVRSVLLEVAVDNEPAQRLYDAYGFDGVGVRKGYYQPSNTDALVMRRDERP